MKEGNVVRFEPINLSLQIFPEIAANEMWDRDSKFKKHFTLSNMKYFYLNSFPGCRACKRVKDSGDFCFLFSHGGHKSPCFCVVRFQSNLESRGILKSDKTGHVQMPNFTFPLLQVWCTQ